MRRGLELERERDEDGDGQEGGYDMCGGGQRGGRDCEAIVWIVLRRIV